MKVLCPLYFTIFLGLLCNAQNVPIHKDYFPPSESNGGWRKNTSKEFVESLGMDSLLLQEFGRWNVDNDWGGNSNMHRSCMVIKDGWIIGEWYADKDGNPISVENGKTMKARLASNSKTFSMLLFGSVLNDAANGKLAYEIGLDSKLYDTQWLPEGFPLSDPRKRAIAFDDIFKHTTGLMPEGAGKERGGERNTFSFVLGKHPRHTESSKLFYNVDCPEEYVLEGNTYSSISYQHLSLVIRNLYQRPSWQVLEENLLTPIGIDEVDYSVDVEESYKNWSNENVRWLPPTGLYMSTRNYARFAWLIMNKGKWGDHQITPSGYLERFTSSGEYANLNTNISKTRKIGSRFFPEHTSNMIRFSGSGMNCAYVFPEMDMIVVRTSQIYPNSIWWNEGESKEKEFLNRLFKSVKNGKPTMEMTSNGPALPGQIIEDPEGAPYLFYNKDDNNDGRLDTYFLCGPGSPEGFLYRGYRNLDGTRDGDQLELIDKLKKYGGNSIYLMAVRTHGGDAPKDILKDPGVYADDLHNPWNNQDPSAGLNEKLLNQWEIWFSEMDKNNITIYFFIYDDAIDVGKSLNWPLQANGELHPKEREFVQTLVKRFKHHKNLIWCVMEEAQEIGDQWQLHTSKIAEAIREADNYNHVIASHQLGGNVFFHANDPIISQFAIQTDKNEVIGPNQLLYDWMLDARKNSKGKYSLNMAEDHVHGNFSVPNKDRKEIRQRNWIAAMTGAYSMVYGMEIKNTPAAWLKDCNTLGTFFESTTFYTMKPKNSLAHLETEYVLALDAFDYILYSSKANENLGMRQTVPGDYAMTWLDCVSGESKYLANNHFSGGQTSFEVPEGFGSEVALYISRKDQRPTPATRATEQVDSEIAKENIPPIAADFEIVLEDLEETYIQLNYNDPDGGPGPYRIRIIDQPKYGKLSGNGNDRYYQPNMDFTDGDSFSWQVNDGAEDSRVVQVRIHSVE